MLYLLAKTVEVEVAQRAAVHVSEVARVAVAGLLIVAPGRAFAVVRAHDGKLRHVPPRTVRPSRTQHTLRVEPPRSQDQVGFGFVK